MPDLYIGDEQHHAPARFRFGRIALVLVLVLVLVFLMRGGK